MTAHSQSHNLRTLTPTQTLTLAVHVSIQTFPFKNYALVDHVKKGKRKCINIALIFVVHARHSGMDNTVLPAIKPMPAFTS